MELKDLMAELYMYMQERKTAEAKEKEIKEKINELMTDQNMEDVEDDYLKIHMVKETKSVSLDTSALKKKEPELYEELFNDYKKETHRSGYMKVMEKTK